MRGRLRINRRSSRARRLAPGKPVRHLLSHNRRPSFARPAFEALGVTEDRRTADPDTPPTAGFKAIMREAAETRSYAAALSVLVVAEWLYLATGPPARRSRCRSISCTPNGSRCTTMRAGLDLSAFPQHEIEIRGRREILAIRTLASAGWLPPTAGGLIPQNAHHVAQLCDLTISVMAMPHFLWKATSATPRACRLRWALYGPPPYSRAYLLHCRSGSDFDVPKRCQLLVNFLVGGPRYLLNHTAAERYILDHR